MVMLKGSNLSGLAPRSSEGMFRFIRFGVCLSVLLGLGALPDCGGGGPSTNNQSPPSNNPPSSRVDNFAVIGTSLIDHRTGNTLFLKGVGYSPFQPGETPIWGGNLPNDNRYLNHLNMIKSLNVNFLMVFPQLMPQNFFVALDTSGLIYAQDIYVDGNANDLLDDNFQNTTI
jgi:hypothetical protein